MSSTDTIVLPLPEGAVKMELDDVMIADLHSAAEVKASYVYDLVCRLEEVKEWLDDMSVMEAADLKELFGKHHPEEFDAEELFNRLYDKEHPDARMMAG